MRPPEVFCVRKIMAIGQLSPSVAAESHVVITGKLSREAAMPPLTTTRLDPRVAKVLQRAALHKYRCCWPNPKNRSRSGPNNSQWKKRTRRQVHQNTCTRNKRLLLLSLYCRCTVRNVTPDADLHRLTHCSLMLGNVGISSATHAAASISMRNAPIGICELDA